MAAAKSPITDLTKIPPKEPYKHIDSYATTIPDKYRDRIISLIDDMENELHTSFTIRVAEHGKNTTEIYPLEERKRTYEVTMNQPYAVLNGSYASLEAIKTRIYELSVQSLTSKVPITFEKVHNRIVWKCPKCKTYGYSSIRSGKTDLHMNTAPMVNSWNESCNYCNFDPEFKKTEWHQLEVWASDGIIGTSSGGSMSEIITHGTLTIMKESPK